MDAMASAQRLLVLLAAMVTLTACARRELVAPLTLVSPYDTVRGEALWAVVPLNNDSGTTLLDPTGVSDAVVRACSQIRGVRCLPLNRVIAEMRGLGLASLSSPDEARALADRLGVDGLIVGSITDFDPYNPPRLGLALVLDANTPAAAGEDLSLEALRGSTGEAGGSRSTARFEAVPAASISVTLDGRNHATLMELRSYAQGRHDPAHANGWEHYLASMPLYTEFAAHAAVARLLDQERLRLARARAWGRVTSR
jgi:hypothetical protein